jgi:AraC-like DNA-binding protein
MSRKRLLLRRKNFTLSANPTSWFSPQLLRTIAYIRQHLSEPLSISQLCRYCCMSRANFFRAFKRATGLSPVAFINRERVLRAAQLLLQDFRSLADVCYQVGFNSVSYFIRTFKKHLGMTPLRYRATVAKVRMSLGT